MKKIIAFILGLIALNMVFAEPSCVFNMTGPFAREVGAFNLTLHVNFSDIPDGTPVTINCYGPGPVSSSGLAAYYRFDKLSEFGESGTFIYDFSGNGNHGTCSGASCPPWTSSGIIGGTFDYDGSNDYFRVPYTSNLFGSEGTVSAWFYQKTTLSDAGVLHKGDLSSWTDEDLSLQFNGASNKFRIIAYNSSGSHTDFYPNTVFSLNTWYHIVFVWNNSYAWFYVNGIIDKSGAKVLGPIRNSLGGINIGSQIPSQARFKGLIDEVRIYNRMLSASEILTLYGSGTIIESGKTIPTIEHPKDPFKQYAQMNCTYPQTTYQQTYHPTVDFDYGGNHYTCQYVVYDLPTTIPGCTIVPGRSTWIGPFETQVNITGINVPEDDYINVSCGNDTTETRLFQYDIYQKTTFNCTYNHTRSNKIQKIIVRGANDSIYNCTYDFSIYSPPYPYCSINPIPSTSVGPFNSNITYCVWGLPPYSYIPGNIKARIRCNVNDTGTVVDVTRMNAMDAIPSPCQTWYSYRDSNTWPSRLCPGDECPTKGYIYINCSYPKVDIITNFTTYGNTSFPSNNYFAYTTCVWNPITRIVTDRPQLYPDCIARYNQTCTYGTQSDIYYNATLFQLPEDTTTTEMDAIEVGESCKVSHNITFYGKSSGRITFVLYNSTVDNSTYLMARFNSTCHYSDTNTTTGRENITILWINIPVRGFYNYSECWYSSAMNFRDIPPAVCAISCGNTTCNASGEFNITNLRVTVQDLQRNFSLVNATIKASCYWQDSDKDGVYRNKTWTFTNNLTTHYGLAPNISAPTDVGCFAYERYVLRNFTINLTKTCSYPFLGVVYNQTDKILNNKTFHIYAEVYGNTSNGSFWTNCSNVVYDYPVFQPFPNASIMSWGPINFSGDYNLTITFCMKNIPEYLNGSNLSANLKCMTTDSGIDVPLTYDSGGACPASDVIQGTALWSAVARRNCSYPQVLADVNDYAYGGAIVENNTYEFTKTFIIKNISCTNFNVFPDYGTSTYTANVTLGLNKEVIYAQTVKINITCNESDNGRVFNAKNQNFTTNCTAIAPASGKTMYRAHAFVSWNGGWHEICTRDYLVHTGGMLSFYKWLGNSGVDNWDDNVDADFDITPTELPYASANYNVNASCRRDYFGSYYNNGTLYIPYLHRFSSGPRKIIWEIPDEQLKCVKESSGKPYEFYVNLRVETHLENITTSTMALAIDSSGSMTASGSHKLDDVKIATKRFVDSSDPNDQLSIVKFQRCTSYSVWGLDYIDGSKSAIKTAIDLIDSGGNTNITAALKLSLQKVLGYGYAGNVTLNYKYIVLFSDGKSTCNDDPYANDSWCENSTCMSVIDKARNTNVRIYTIGYQPSELTELFLQQIASDTGATFYEAQNSAEITEIYERLAADITSRIMNVTVVDELPSFVQVNAASIEQGEGDMTDNKTKALSVDYNPGNWTIRNSTCSNQSCVVLTWQSFNLTNGKFWAARYRVKIVNRTGQNIPMGINSTSYAQFTSRVGGVVYPQNQSNFTIPEFEVQESSECTITTSKIAVEPVPHNIEVNVSYSGYPGEYEVNIDCAGEASELCTIDTTTGATLCNVTCTFNVARPTYYVTVAINPLGDPSRIVTTCFTEVNTCDVVV